METGATLRLTENLPQLSASASLHTSVTRTCTSIGPNDFEYFTTAFLVGAGARQGSAHPVPHPSPPAHTYTMLFDIYEHPSMEASYEDTPAIMRVGQKAVEQLRMFTAALAAAASWRCVLSPI